jgi:hypothetical protein
VNGNRATGLVNLENAVVEENAAADQTSRQQADDYCRSRRHKGARRRDRD